MTTKVTSKQNENRRQTYLLKTLGFSHDPFADAVAEQEIHSRISPSRFFSYYIDPQIQESSQPILHVLREACNGLIFGEPGSGKTTLRYILEAECRSVFDRTLVVTYELSEKGVRPPTSDQHWARLAKELATDLFIQVVELLAAIDMPNEQQKQQFQAQMTSIWRRRLDKLIRRIMEKTPIDSDLSALWPRLSRPAVRYINYSIKVNNFIQECLPQTSQVHDTREEEERASRSLSGEALLEAGIGAAKTWGFERIFVLVDGVDAYKPEVDDMLNLITPLLSHLEQWQTKDLFFYFFLTDEMYAPVTKVYGESLKNLPFPPVSYIIRWTQDTLADLLHQRLQAAGSRTPSLDALAATAFEQSLEDCLIDASQGSPRRLLQIVSALIDAHADRDPEQLLITPDDWHQVQSNWIYDSALPFKLPTTSFF